MSVTNTLVTIGRLGSYRAYLNVAVKDAHARYNSEYDDYYPQDELDSMTNTFTFEDEFEVYEAHAIS